MKIKLLALAAIMATSFTAAAEESDLDCLEIEKAAGSVMQARQLGVSLSELLEMIDESAPSWRAVVLDAYETPRYQTEQAQQRVIEDFKTKYSLACEKSRG